MFLYYKDSKYKLRVDDFCFAFRIDIKEQAFPLLLLMTKCLGFLFDME